MPNSDNWGLHTLIPKDSEQLWPDKPALSWLQGEKPSPRLKKTPLLCHPNQKLSNETRGWGLTMPVNLCICNMAGHKLYVKHLTFSNVVINLAQLWCSQAWAIGTVWGAKPAPSNKAVSMAETQGSTLPRAVNHHPPHWGDFLHPTVPRDLAADMPSSAQLLLTGVVLSSPSQPTGEAKRSTGQVGG